MNLAAALALQAPVRLALVGAGGKTTALFYLARRLPGPVWITTTTHLAAGQASLADRHYVIDSPSNLQAARLLNHKVALVTGPPTPDGKLTSPPAPVLARLRSFAKAARAFLLVEADGARQLPLKAPGENEPQIPEWCDIVIVTIGLTAIGQPLTGQWVHRPEQFAALSGIAPGSLLTPAAVASVLLHPQGGLKWVPPTARRVALLNQADTPGLQQAAAALASILLAGGYDGVFAGSLRDDPENGTWFD